MTVSNQRTNQCVPVLVSSHGRSFSAASCPQIPLVAVPQPPRHSRRAAAHAVPPTNCAGTVLCHGGPPSTHPMSVKEYTTSANTFFSL
eukprot:scaffold19476_cov86-Phaeocystis_antarctica.AAC.4